MANPMGEILDPVLSFLDEFYPEGQEITARDLKIAAFMAAFRTSEVLHNELLEVNVSSGRESWQV